MMYTQSRVKWTTVALACFLSACYNPSTELPPVPRDARVDSLFAHYNTEGSPGAAVMVIQNGEVLHSAGYGLANIETGSPITPETQFRLGSVSKAFFMMGIMVLAERDSLDYDDPVSKWIPELDRFQGITIRHMMTQTSGLPDYYADSVFANIPQLDSDPLTTHAEAAKIYESWGELQFIPGEMHGYGNSAFEMLALVIERISGQSARQFMRDNVFTPLDLPTADVRDRQEFSRPNVALGYILNTDSTAWEPQLNTSFDGLPGAGQIYASLLDLYKWDQALYEGGVVSEERLSQAFQPIILNDGSTGEVGYGKFKGKYGFGWFIGERNGHDFVYETGHWLGFKSYFKRFIDEELSFVILTNSEARVEEYQEQLAKLYLN